MDPEDFEYSIATTPPTRFQRRLATGITAALILSFSALVPFGAVQLPQINSFVPTVEAIIFITDLTTSALIFNQFAIVGRRSLLILANGYLFSGLIVIPHALSYPGAFTPAGLFGHAIQSTPWLFTFWHFGFSVAVLGFAALNGRQQTTDGDEGPAASAIYGRVVVVVCLVCALTWLVAAQERILPPLMLDEVRFAPLANYVTIVTFVTSCIALLVLWIRQRSTLDLWLCVATIATVVEQATTAFVIASRFSVGFYVGRIFSVIVSIVVLMALLSETVRVYAMLSNANKRLRRERESKLTNLQAAIAAIGHEMRQPLTAITTKGSAARRFLSSESPDLSRVAKLLQDILDSGFRASEVLESIGALFKGGGQDLRPVQVNDLIRDSLKLLHDDLQRHDVAVHTHLALRLPSVAGHRGQLQEVIFNLIQNAIEAMEGVERNARFVHIETGCVDSKAVAISVADSGPGIEPDKVDTIFEAFVTTKAKGKGLGLAISEMIIARHGGKISARSDAIGGARFQIMLPISEVTNSSANAQVIMSPVV